MKKRLLSLAVGILPLAFVPSSVSAQSLEGRVMDRCDEDGRCFRVLCGARDCEILGGERERRDHYRFWSRDEFREHLRREDFRIFFSRDNEEDR